MADREEVIRGLNILKVNLPNIIKYDDLVQAAIGYVDDALELLKEKEPQSVISDRQCEVEPERWERKGFCPKCHQVVLWMVNREYCGFCGQRVKWNELS